MVKSVRIVSMVRYVTISEMLSMVKYVTIVCMVKSLTIISMLLWKGLYCYKFNHTVGEKKDSTLHRAYGVKLP